MSYKPKHYKNDYYILGGYDGITPVVADRETWASWLGAAERTVAVDEQDGIMVSTVFLGLNHRWGDGPPMIFETMIFGGPHDQWMDRYSTWAEAEEGHKKACEIAGVKIKPKPPFV